MNLRPPRRRRTAKAPAADIDRALATLDLQRTPRGRIAQEGRPVVVVLGMHRSGTALLANMLHYLGADMADHTDVTSSKNPNGFWERPDIVALHDDVLGVIRRPVDSPLHALPFPSGWWRDKKLMPLKARMTEVVRKHLAETNGTWGFKDPRTCRLLPLWSEIFEELGLRPHYVWSIRTPGEAAASMAAKNPRLRPFSPQHAEVMWLAYNYDILRHLIGTHPTIVDYGEWFDDPLAVGRRLLRQLDLRGFDTERECADCIHGIFHSEFRHFVEGHGDASSSIPLAQGLFKDLAELSRSEAGASEERLSRYLGLLEIIFGTLQPFAQSLSEVPALRKAIRLGEERVTELTAKSEELAERSDELTALELLREAESATLHAKGASLAADLDTARVSIEALAATLSAGGAEPSRRASRHEDLVSGRRADEMEDAGPPPNGTQPRPVGEVMKEPAENSAALAMSTPDRKELAAPLPLRESELAKLQAKAANLQAQLDEAIDQASDVVGQLASRTKERDELTARLHIRAAAFAALKAHSVKIRAEIEVTKQRLSHLAVELDAGKRNSAALQAELEALASDKQTLAATLTEVRADGRRAVALHTQTQTRIKAALATERERGDRLEAHIGALRAEHATSLEQARRQIAEIEASLARAGQEREYLSARLAQAELSRDEVSANLVQTAAEKKDLSARLKEAEASRDDFSSRLAKAERSWKDVTEKLQQNGRDKESLAARLVKADHDKVDLAAKLQTAVDEKNSLAARLMKADRDKVDLTAKLQTAVDDKSNLATRLVKADRDKVDMAARWDTATRERDGLTARLAKADREIADLAASLSGSEAERRELRIASAGYLARIDAQSRQPLLRHLFSFSGNRRSLKGQAKGGVASIKLNPAAGVEGFLDRFGPSRIQGWLYRPDRPSEPLRIALYDGERFLCTAVADHARADVAREGRMTRRCGFDLPVPQQLFDGNVHKVDIRLAGTAASLLSRPLLIKLDVQPAKG